jgi:hypothetical protein
LGGASFSRLLLRSIFSASGERTGPVERDSSMASFAAVSEG